MTPTSLPPVAPTVDPPGDADPGRSLLPPAVYSLTEPTLEESLAEWSRFYARSEAGLVDPDGQHCDEYVAFFDGEVRGFGPDPVRLRLDAAHALNVHPERLVISYLGA